MVVWAKSDGMIFRVIQKLQEYDYQIVHRPGDKHCNTDGLSQRPNDVPRRGKSVERTNSGVHGIR